MLQLMKYEFRKQMFSKIIILAILGILEVLFIAAVLVKREGLMAGSIIGLYAIACMAAFYVSIEVIITYSNDLKTKQSYMLFLTPNSAYKIIGAKVFCAIIQIFISAALFLALGFADVFFLAVRYSKVQEVIDAAKEILSQVSGLEVTLPKIITVLLLVFLFWVSTVIFALLSITLSTTLLENKKFKWVISFLTFILINIMVYRVIGLATNQMDAGSYLQFAVSGGLSAVFIALASFGTSWMLEKKISL